MYVMEGMGAVLPVTSEMAHAVGVARMRNLTREANQSRFGFGNTTPLINVSPDFLRNQISRNPGLLRTIFGPGAAGDFMEAWGVPIGAGLLGLAGGLVMAKTLKRKKRV